MRPASPCGSVRAACTRLASAPLEGTPSAQISFRDWLGWTVRTVSGPTPWRSSSRVSPSGERDAVYSHQSAAVRLGARADLARALAVDEERLEIVCDPGPTGRRPPRVLLNGLRTAADVSLSHDGQWIAWVIWTGNDSGEA